MKALEGSQQIKQLEKRKGGYFYLSIDAAIVNKFERQKATRLICTLENKVSFRCGLNHLGDGNFFIIIASRYMKQLGRKADEDIDFKIEVDPDQLGVEIPEILSALLAQDDELRSIFDSITDGKKRTLIYSLVRIKDFDKRVKHIVDFLHIAKQKIKKPS